MTNNPVEDPEDTTAFETAPYAVVDGVKDGVITVRLGGMDNEADPNDMRAAPGKVELALTLTAKSDNDAISFPMDRGSVMAKVTFTGDGDDDGGSFTDAFTDYVTVFNIRPAQCELLFQVVTVMDPWNTALSVTNPAYGDEMASGGLEFIFYGQGNVKATYSTTVDMNTGRGLELDGTLSPGGTYQVMVNEILAATGWGETFLGHVHLTADYTNCSGLGWVTDFMGVNQAYTAIVINADTGSDIQ